MKNYIFFSLFIGAIMLFSFGTNSPTHKIGELMYWCGPTPQTGYLVCDGRQVANSDYPALFQAIGYHWGGNGVDSFRIPNAVNRMPLGVDTAGVYGGVDSLVLSADNLPAYNIPLNMSVSGTVTVHCNEEDPNQTEGNQQYLGNTDSPLVYNDAGISPGFYLLGVTHNLYISDTIQAGGQGNKVFNKPLYYGVRVLIKY